MANFVRTNFTFRSRFIVFGIEHCKDSMSTSRFEILSVFSRPPAIGLDVGLPVVPFVHPVVPVVHPVVQPVVHPVVHLVVHPQLPHNLLGSVLIAVERNMSTANAADLCVVTHSQICRMLSSTPVHYGEVLMGRCDY